MKGHMEPYFDVALIYSTFICDNFNECGNEIFDHPTVDRIADDWEEQFAQYAFDQGWGVAKGESLICWCPDCYKKT